MDYSLVGYIGLANNVVVSSIVSTPIVFNNMPALLCSLTHVPLSESVDYLENDSLVYAMGQPGDLVKLHVQKEAALPSSVDVYRLQ